MITLKNIIFLNIHTPPANNFEIRADSSDPDKSPPPRLPNRPEIWSATGGSATGAAPDKSSPPPRLPKRASRPVAAGFGAGAGVPNPPKRLSSPRELKSGDASSTGGAAGVP